MPALHVCEVCQFMESGEISLGLITNTAGRRQALSMSRNETRGNKASHAISNRIHNKRRNSGYKRSPEVLDEVKVNQNFHFYLRNLLFILESLHPLSLSAAHAKKSLFIYTLVSKYSYDSQKKKSLYA